MTLNNPRVQLSILGSAQRTQPEDQRVLLLGQMISGTATAGTLERDVSDSPTEINALFGARSMAALMARAFKAVNKNTVLDVLPIADNGAGVAATAVVAFSGTATAAGTITVNVGSKANNSYEIDVASGDTATDVGDALAAAITADTSAPFTAANVTGTVTITASNKGTWINDAHLSYSGSAAGVTVALTAWAGGATDPDVTNIFSSAGDSRYQTVIYPGVYTLSELSTFLDDRFNVSNGVKDGRAFVKIDDTLSNLKTTASGVNSQNVVIIGDQISTGSARKGSIVPEFNDVVSSVAGAVRALRLTPGADVSSILSIQNSPSDAFGGAGSASLPYHNTELPNVEVPNIDDFWTEEEQRELEAAGVSVVGANRANTATVMGQMVTSYLTNTSGDSDTTYKFLNTVDTSSVIREYFVANIQSEFGQSRLTNGDLIKGRKMTNEADVRAFLKGLYIDLESEGLVQAGQAARADFEKNLIVSIDLTAGKIMFSMAPLLVSQVRVVIGTQTVNFGG